ncbi:MAG: formyltetrahydrofolate deformylase [Candidatus Omnitrophica bacterium]|nr:formyltetrahydrofolate deformylase [Candidatus Omnitrophota bacterium]
MNEAIMLITCPDKKGINASVTGFIYQNNGNIIHAEQHTDEQTNAFFMRIEWTLGNFAVQRDKIKEKFEPIAKKFNMKWGIYFSDEIPRVAIFVSKHLHCLYDLLLRHQGGQFSCKIPVIISNHPDARAVAKEFGIKFVEMSAGKGGKAGRERKQLDILKKEKIDLVVFARYMQIVGRDFVNEYSNRIINIHHSFLPAFIGKEPYVQAYRKGVKIIGATSHYVTEKLDKGPIIEQDTVRISHRDSLVDLVRSGEDLEKVVLSRAVRWHLERKILCHSNKTVVFN